MDPQRGNLDQTRPTSGVITPYDPKPRFETRRAPPVEHLQRPPNGTRPYQGPRESTARPPHRSNDHRYARPSYRVVRTHPQAHHPPPVRYHYRPYYCRWYVHPYYRYRYATNVVVWFDFHVSPWDSYWAPPSRAGWMWVPGYWNYGYWHPGFWRPARVAPRPHYVYVPGWWERDVYVEGYYRKDARNDGGWEWIEGYYLEDGTHVRGHWRPTTPGPEGYLWEPGFFDGETYVDGFWRPEFRPGYRWISAYYDQDSVYHGGFWEPFEDQPGYTWVPGWFDGTTWIQGYWVRGDEYAEANVETWTPEEGWNEGWEVGAGWGDGEILDDGAPTRAVGEDEPLAIPVDPR